MRRFIETHRLMLSCFVSGAWVFIAWKLAGMPSPGFYGRILPGAWILAGLLAGRAPATKWLSVFFAVFTVSVWLWQLSEFGWIIAGAAAAAGVIASGAATVIHSGQVVRGILPAVLLSAVTSAVNSDEVRFAEIASSVTGIGYESRLQTGLRTGDIDSETSHHTEFFPLMISPGLIAGEEGLRIVPVVITIAAVVLLGGIAAPLPAFMAAALYPGFSISGLAYTGWLAVLLFLLPLRYGKGKYGTILRLAVVLLLAALKLRYGALGAGMLAAEYFPVKGNLKKKYLFPAILVCALILFLAGDRYLLHGRIFWVRYGNIEALKLIWINIFHRPLHLLSNLGWSLFDLEAGLFFRAPWTLVALAGLPELYRRDRTLFHRLVIPSAFYWFATVIWMGSCWHGLPAPAGRMFLPLVPLFAAGFSQVWRKPAAGVFASFSIAVSALVIVCPALRANYADGTDSLLELLGGSGGFSMIRSNPLNLLMPAVLAAGIFAVFRRSRFAGAHAAIILLCGFFLAGIAPVVPDAEDLDSSAVQGAPLYPRSPDPVNRALWITETERLLELSEPGQSILLPCNSSADSLLLEMSSSGGALMVGDTVIHVETELAELPEDYQFLGRNERVLPDLPENRIMEIYHLPLNAYRDTLRIIWYSGNPVYLDRAGVF
ncbi:hypothetical protein CSA37_05040 [Candidatus Fermentibacteria bacterium]|nr:MAG: hypothetical protein CSA37_10330 [Candidatus Fermentibacteria bacterium]PIE52294.1 MAG: hypothetical protein CSA37_07435 [Candidatus Fermentibacteria bacterium]PIE52789.1 MAG: hypothetical protein CSA37_05040 [Candidatus Fermentibacteria bacterium]